MTRFSASNTGARPQAIAVLGGTKTVRPGRTIEVEPSPDLDDDMIAHFEQRGVTFLEIEDVDEVALQAAAEKAAAEKAEAEAKSAAEKAAAEKAEAEKAAAEAKAAAEKAAAETSATAAQA